MMLIGVLMSMASLFAVAYVDNGWGMLISIAGISVLVPTTIFVCAMVDMECSIAEEYLEELDDEKYAFEDRPLQVITLKGGKYNDKFDSN